MVEKGNCSGCLLYTSFTLDGLLMEVAGANAVGAFVSAFAVDSFGGVVQLLAVRRQHALCGKPKQNKKDTT